MFWGLLTALAFVTFVGLPTAGAQAAFVYDISYTRPGGPTGSGRITFDTLTGSNASGVSSANISFQLSGQSTTFTQGDLTGGEWNIDGTTNVVNSLFLEFEQSSAGTFALDLRIGFGPVSVGCGGASSSSSPGNVAGCFSSPNLSLSSGGTGNVTATLVPVPAALPLLGTALAGVGLIGWRRRARA